MQNGALIEDVDLDPPPLVISQPTSLQAAVLAPCRCPYVLCRIVCRYVPKGAQLLTWHVQALVCEILHPTAHWTGNLDDEGDFIAHALERNAFERNSRSWRTPSSTGLPTGLPSCSCCERSPALSKTLGSTPARANAKGLLAAATPLSDDVGSSIGTVHSVKALSALFTSPTDESESDGTNTKT